MATPGTVDRTVETGDTFRTLDSGGVKSQATGLVGTAGEHVGIAGDPLVVSVEGAVDPTAGIFVPFKSTGFVDSFANIAAGACELRQLRAIISSSEIAELYLQWFASTTVPADTTAALWEMLVPPNGEASESFLKGEMALTPGCSFAVSSTPDILTITSSSAMKIYGVRV